MTSKPRSDLGVWLAIYVVAREAVWHLRAPVIQSLFHEMSSPASLQALGLVEVLDWTAAALDRVEREAFFERFSEGEVVPYFYEPFLISTKGGQHAGGILDASVAVDAEDGFQRFCSASIAGPEVGLDDHVFFTGEERFGAASCAAPS